MPTITLEQIEAQHAKTSEMIAAFKANLPTTYVAPSITLDLAAGEEYGGLMLDDEGQPSHHVVLLPGEADDINYEDALAWASKQGGDLPTPNEQSLLYANLKRLFQDAWYWSSKEHPTNKNCAFVQRFSNGDQYGTRDWQLAR